MTCPRRVVPGTTYLLTRRCTQRCIPPTPYPRPHTPDPGSCKWWISLGVTRGDTVAVRKRVREMDRVAREGKAQDAVIPTQGRILSPSSGR